MYIKCTAGHTYPNSMNALIDRIVVKVRKGIILPALIQAPQVHLLYPRPRPGSPPQECQAGLDTGIMRKAADRHHLPHLLPAVDGDQMIQNIFQLHAVQGVVGLVQFRLSG